MYDEDEDMFGCVASIDTLEQAVAFCKKSIDNEIADAIKKAESGEITTAKQIKEARSELSNFGWNYYVKNAEHPMAKDAFDFLVSPGSCSLG